MKRIILGYTGQHWATKKWYASAKRDGYRNHFYEVWGNSRAMAKRKLIKQVGQHYGESIAIWYENLK